MRSVKFYLDRPTSLDDPAVTPPERRAGFLALIDALIRGEHPFSLMRKHAFAHADWPDLLADGIYYAYHAEQAPGARSYCIKQGALPHHWFMDAGGYGGWCTLANDADLQDRSAQFDLDRARAVIEALAREMREQNLSNYAQPDGPAALPCDDGFVFFPLQTADDEVHELSSLGQPAMLRRASELAAATGVSLVVKRHPRCASPMMEAAIADAAAKPGVHVTDGSVNDLVSRARSVIVTNSGVGLQALVLGCPVFAAGRSEYSHICTRIDTLDALAPAFEPPPATLPERSVRQLGYLLDEYLVDMRDPDRIARRIEQHITENPVTERGLESEKAVRHGQAVVAAARRVQITMREQVIFLLDIYHDLPAPQKAQTARALLVAARSGSHLERILRGTDSDVLDQVMAYHIGHGNWDAAARVATLAHHHKLDGAEAVLVRLAGAFYQADRGDPRWRHFARVAADLPEAGVSTLTFAARRLMAVGDLGTEPRALIARAQEMEPDDPLTLWLAARLAREDGKLAEALDLARQAAAQAPNNDTYSRLVAALDAAIAKDTA